MPRRPEGLQKRGNIYWLRVRVPNELRDKLGKTEVKRSLRTSDYRDATNQVRLARARVDKEFSLARRELGQPRSVPLSDDEIWFRTVEWFVESERYALKNTRSLGDSEAIEEAKHNLHMILHPEYGPPIAYEMASKVVAAKKLNIEPGSPQWRLLSDNLLRALIESERRCLMRAAIPFPIEEDRAFANLHDRTVLQPVARKTVDDLVEAFSIDVTRDELALKSRLKRETAFRIIREFFGSRTPLLEIDRDRVRTFVDLVTRCPKNATKRFGKEPLETLVMLGEAEEAPTMSSVTANSYLGTLVVLFHHAVEEGWLKTNPAKGLKVPSKRAKSFKARHPFTMEELSLLFNAPLYRGCLNDEHGYAKPGPCRPRRGRFWVPLISLFTGMRLNEIVQLTCDDLVTRDSVECILVRDDDTKQVKTEAAVRVVPVHPELKQIGFLAYVAARRKKDGDIARLFPELTVASTGYMSDNFSKWFANFRTKAGVTAPGKVFHSFRHNYRDALREADISAEKVRALGGWSSAHVEDGYGAGLRASTLARDIQKVGYPGLDLTHLTAVDA